jgi:hypothetical protein
MNRLATRTQVAGHEIAERRKRLRVTQRCLAAASGLPLPVLSAVENGRRFLTPAQSQAVDAVLAPLEELGDLGPVTLHYVRAPAVPPERIEHLLRQVVAVLLHLRAGCGASEEATVPAHDNDQD